VGERFGRYESKAEPGALWIHAVSLGETRAAAILVEALREREPGLRLLLTHGTATGRAEGKRLLREGDQQAWLPWDTPGAVAAFLAHFRPRAGVLMETEVWPNLVAGCAKAGVPLALANARLSDKSLRQALRLAPLSRPAYRDLAAVWAQTRDDARRLERAGARVAGVLGNLKFDARPDAALLERGQAWRKAAGRPVVMFASSREGEEAPFLEWIRQHPGSGVAWLLVPRHPQRFDEVAALAATTGLRASRRSAWGDAGPAGEGAAADVWVGDSLGEMPLYYGLADAALLGGSFAPLGGQNLIEAAACGCPVLMGPHTFNFAEASQQAQAAGAALRVAGLEEGMAQAAALVADGARRQAMVAAAAHFAGAHRGAAARTAQAILAL
jgi:3-deoxy-D-manno-octulosonic-acid transferase